jgi:hypothetical protein
VSLPKLGLKPNLGRPRNQPRHLFKKSDKRIFIQHTIADHTQHHPWGLNPWPLDWRQTPLPSSHPTCCDNMLHYILFIKYFILNITKTYILKIHILFRFCSNEMIQVYFFLNSIMYIITFISFWKFKIIWTKKKLNIIIQ